MSSSTGLAVASDPHVFLIGRPPIGELLGFIRTMAVHGQNVDLGDLTAEWRAANDHVLKLEKDEAGAADNPPVTNIAGSLRPLSSTLILVPVSKRAFRFVPADVAVVDLNRVVVFLEFFNI